MKITFDTNTRVLSVDGVEVVEGCSYNITATNAYKELRNGILSTGTFQDIDFTLERRDEIDIRVFGIRNLNMKYN